MTKAKGVLALGGALCLLFGVWLVVMPIMSETHGTPYCGNSKYSKFSFKNGQEFLIPDAYLEDQRGVGFWLDDRQGYVKFIVMDMSQYDGSPNCNKKRGYDAGHITPRIRPYIFETVLNTHKNYYPHRIDGVEKIFDLYRSVNSNNPDDLHNVRDFLVPKNQKWKDTLFIECLRTGAHRSPNKRIGCRVRSKLRDSIMIEYIYDHKYLHQFKEIDMTMKRIISEFIVTPEEGK